MRHIEGAVRVNFNGTTLEGHFIVDGTVITVDHVLLGVKLARLHGAPADAIASVLLSELAFEYTERTRN